MNNEYSKALFELSLEGKKLDVIKELFDGFKSILNDNSDFLKFLESPKISKSEKKDFLLKTLKGFDEEFVFFLYVVIDNNRVDMIDDIYKDFVSLVNNKNNIVDIVVYSVSKLSSKEETEISKKVSANFKGKTIELKNIVDDNLIGGYKLYHNGMQLDISLKSQLDNLKSSL